MNKYAVWLEPDNLIKLEGWARSGLTDKEIAKNMGVGYSSLKSWKVKYPAIGQALAKGKEVVDFEVENALLKRALGYEYKEVTRERIIDTGQKKRHGGESELTAEQWEIALAYFDFKCAYCGKESELTKDHLDALKNGGTLTFDNVVPACKHCNSSKRDRQWLAWYQKQPFYDPKRAEKIADYFRFVLAFPKSEDNTRLVVTKEVIKHVPGDTTAQIFWLKNRKRFEWRELKADRDKQDKLLEAQIEKAKAEAAIAKDRADKLQAGGKENELLLALLDIKSGGDGSGETLAKKEGD